MIRATSFRLLLRGAAFLVPTLALANIPPLSAQSVNPAIHKLCIEAKDYAGCVRSMSSTPSGDSDSLTPLRNAMKQVAARLRSGTSLQDSTDTFRPVVDQLAIVDPSYSDSIAVKHARLASRMFEALQLSWDTRIKAHDYQLSQYGSPIYDCKALQRSVENYNSIPGAPTIDWSYRKGLFGINLCRVDAKDLPEVHMISNVAKILEEGSTSSMQITAPAK